MRQIQRHEEDPQNTREARLDHEEPGGAEMRHENEVSDEQMSDEQKQQRQDEADYDTFMGTVGEVCSEGSARPAKVHKK